MLNKEESKQDLALRQCDDTIRWYQAIIDNPGASQSAKDAAKDLLKQAERQKQDILSGNAKL